MGTDTRYSTTTKRHLENCGVRVRRRLLAKIQCPHCWTFFQSEDICWVANHPDLRGDSILTVDSPKRFVPSRFAVSGEALDAFDAPCRHLACPHCHLILPSVLLEHKSRIMSIAGTPGSGKTYFLTSASWQLRQILDRGFGLAISDADPESNQALVKNEQLMFLPENPNQLVVLEKTQLEGTQYSTVQIEPGQTITLPQPFMFTIRPTARHVNARGAEVLTEVLCMYDNAGEHFLPGSDSLTSPTTQHLSHSKNIFFLFDPSQDVRFRSRLLGLSSDPQIGQVRRAFRQDNVLLEMAARIRRHAGMSADEKLRQPLTIVVTKSDIWKKLLKGFDIETEPYQLEERLSGSILGRINKDYVELVSRQIENLLVETVPEFVSAVNDISAQALYIPVSATGGATQLDPSTGLLKIRAADVKPCWATVPFLYEFSRWGKLVGSIRQEGTSFV